MIDLITYDVPFYFNYITFVRIMYILLYVHINIYIRNILSCTHEENINI